MAAETTSHGDGTSLAADDDQLVRLLMRHVSFAYLGEDHLARVIAESRVEEFDTGVTVIAQGDEGTFAYLVIEGALAVEVEATFGKTTVAMMRSGDMVGEIGAFASAPRTASVTALTPVRLLRLEQRTMRNIMTEHPDVALSVISELGQRLQSINGAMATFSHAATALAEGRFEADMLTDLKAQASRLSHFAEVFEAMANEITSKEMRTREMQMAAQIQRAFLPGVIDTGSHADAIDIAGTVIPAKQVGGDFYDYFRVGSQRFVFVVGDVSGSGVPAALFMTVCRTVLRTIARGNFEAGTVFTHMNEILLRDNPENLSLNVFFGGLDLETGELDYCGAGHDLAYLVKAEGGLDQLTRLGPAVGQSEDATYATRRRTLAPGEQIVLASDGIAPGGAVADVERFQAIVRGARSSGPDGIVAAVSAVADGPASEGEQGDDITCLAVRFKGP